MKKIKTFFSVLMLFSLCVGGHFFASCQCSPPEVSEEKGEKEVADAQALPEPIVPPELWGKKRMALGQTCGLYEWGELQCEKELVCARKESAKQGTCLRFCSSKEKNCPQGLSCQRFSVGVWACLTTRTLSQLGEVCTKTPCTPPYLCVRSKQEKEEHCRPPCDPSPHAKDQCKKGFVCGLLPTSGGSCIPLSSGSIKEFGRCGNVEGRCSDEPIPLRCIAESSRKPLWGSCLRSCSKDGRCGEGQHCIASLKACAKRCDISKGNTDCPYGECLSLKGEVGVSVCY